MTNRTLTKLAQLSNLARTEKKQVRYQTVNRLNRLSSVMEPLENRTMMSVAHHPVVSHVKPKTPAPIKAAATTLVVPGTLTATAVSATSVKVTWTDSDGTATGYDVLRAVNGASFTQVSQITSRSIFTYVDTAVATNTSYTYKVQAYNATKTSQASATITVKTPLATPTGLTAAAQSGTKMALSWTDNDSSAAGYYILRSTDGVHFTTLTTLTGKTAATYIDSTVGSGQAYKYEVQAFQGTSTSAVSAIATGITPLAAPVGLVSSAQSSSLIHLTWTNKDSSATGYIVVRSTNGVNYTALSTLGSAGANSMDDKSVLPFTTYYYEVEATSAATASAVSNSTSATTPLAVPTGVIASATGATSIKLTWTDSDAAAQGYIVLRSANGSTYSQVASSTSRTLTTWTDNTVTCNSTYFYEVQATNGGKDSAASTPYTITTPMSAPNGVTATVNGITSVTLNWTDTDPTATQYVISRSVNGAAFAILASVTGNAAANYTDNTVSSGHSYSYEIVSATTNKQSPVSAPATAVTALAAPTNVVVNAISGTSVVLTWTNNDFNATGYKILRSNDGVTFSQVGAATNSGATTFTDTTASSAHSYYYQVQAYNAVAVSAAASSAKVTTPLLVPAGFTATVVGSWVNLIWTDKDPLATSYVIQRSTDGIFYTTLTQLNSPTAQSYVDQTVTSGQKYYYQIQAVSSALSSPMSAPISVTVTTPTPAKTTVIIGTRNTGELVITATGTSDTVSVTQSGSTLTITADGQTTTQPAPTQGLFIYTRGGLDNINVDQSVTVRTTIETIDAAVDDIASQGTNVSVWDDSNDIYTGDATVHTVNTFAGGVAKTAGASLKDPSDIGSIMHVSGSLWGTGPTASDVNQGQVGDCYFLSSLAAFAGEQPKQLEESAVDMGDGTYTVQFINNGTPTFVRVSNDISTYGGGNYVYAHPGASGDLWAVVMEKAFAYFRTGANTYNSLNSGWMGSVYADLGVNSTFFDLSSMNSSSLYSTLSTALASGKEVTLGTGSAPNLVSGHAYTLISCSVDANGVASYVVRNPWGVSGDSLENSQGYATLTFAQMQANFLDCCVAV